MRRCPDCLDRNEIGDVFCDDGTSLFLSETENPIVARTPHCDFMNRYSVDMFRTQRDAYCRREHFIEEIFHEYKRERVTVVLSAVAIADSLSAIRSFISSGNSA